uniref:Ring finger protein n=1 Tax=Rhizophora mucronata TaxID=61149 RepID=A0A2P2JLK9_RHIMU
MGSGGSKAYCGGESSSDGGGWKGGRSKGKRNGSSLGIFQSSCLGATSGSGDERCIDRHVHCRESKENGGNASSAGQNEIESDQVKVECYPKVKVEQPNEMACVGPNVELDEWNEVSITNSTSRTGSSSARAASARSLASPSRFLSRFSFIPGNVSFRLSRATSLGSSRAYSIPPTSLRVFNDHDEACPCPSSASGGTNGGETYQGCDMLPISLFNRAPRQCDENTSTCLPFNSRTSSYLDNAPDNRTVSSPNRGAVSARMGLDGNLHPPRAFGDLDSVETRLSDMRAGAREPIERNVRFSRTLSVGRLRDRVLQRSSLSDVMFCPPQEQRGPRDTSHVSGRQAMGGEMRISEFEGDTHRSPTSSGNVPSSMSSSVFSFQDHEVETSRSREARYHDLLEHRSNFLERRRRVRSQVRALQRLGSRFENLSGHQRSCILSGQHRMGRCTCRADNRESRLDENTSARASISRIVMLAEALFEVLDEIHQQSVVLSSRPSVSSLGSIPAPNEVVESLPIKLYLKSQKHHNEEVAQCYICLVEYDEGDCMRVLPCHHEFHRTCIDKWLKEIHRY